MQRLLLSALIICVAACAATHLSREQRRFDKLAKNCWHYNDSSKRNEMRYNCSMEFLNSRNGLVGRDTSEVTRLFGTHRYRATPQQEFPKEKHIVGKFVYKCFYKNEEGHWLGEMLEFFYTSEGKVGDIDYGVKTD